MCVLIYSVNAQLVSISIAFHLFLLQTQLHVCALMCRSEVDICHSQSPYCFLRQGLLMNLGPTSSERLDAWMPVTGVLPWALSLPIQLWGYRCVLLCLSFAWVWCIVKKIVIAWRALYQPLTHSSQKRHGSACTE